MSDSLHRRFENAGLILPEAKAPIGAYVPYMQTGNLIFISGQGPVSASGVSITGRLGEALENLDGTRAPQMAALNILAQLNQPV